jgi:large conductance mechanosensitive channel
MGLISEFKEFALKGNVLDLAVGVIIGGAFGGIVTSLINDIIMPPIGMALNKVDFSQMRYVLQPAYAKDQKLPDGTLAAKDIAEVAIRYGNFITIMINFIILAFCIFIVVKMFNAARKRFEAQKPAAAPAGPSKEQVLLTEIRDLLARKV